MPKKTDRSVFMDAAHKFMDSDFQSLTRQQVAAICDEHGVEWPNWLTQNPENRAARGVYNIPKELRKAKVTKKVKHVDAPSEASVQMAQTATVVTVPSTGAKEISLVPTKIRGYVPFGNFNDVRAIITSKVFYPVFVTGLSGNGKTMMIDQVCAVENRELIRVNITIETDEDDLLGGFRLVDGKTVWHDGPVITAMERGAVLLLDEVDLGSNKLMCLQPVLEGKSVFLKKIGKLIEPQPGFNIIATANTKGKGSDDGRFIGTNVLNEAFLERFSITMEQEYPPSKTETKILMNVMKASGIDVSSDTADRKFIDLLIKWADVIRKTFYEGAVTEIISTRRLVHICQAYAIFGRNRQKALTLCLNRFDADTKNSFFDFYKKIDETIDPLQKTVVPDKKDDEIKF